MSHILHNLSSIASDVLIPDITAILIHNLGTVYEEPELVVGATTNRVWCTYLRSAKNKPRYSHSTCV